MIAIRELSWLSGALSGSEAVFCRFGAARRGACAGVAAVVTRCTNSV